MDSVSKVPKVHSHDHNVEGVGHGMLKPTPEPHPLVPPRPSLGSRQSSAASLGQLDQLDQMISDDNMDTETYGVSELRDGFFDAIFLKPSAIDPGPLREYAKTTLPKKFDKGEPLSPKYFVQRQFHELNSLARRVTTTRAGIRLFKSFLAFFIAYVLCLLPAVHRWLGRYSYIMAVSVILNHPARSVGAQIDGAILTTVGTAAGLGWGVVGLLLSTSTLAAQAGFGGILAMFLALFMSVIAWVRSYFVRFYQAVLCAGIAIIFTTLAETSSRSIEWPKLKSYGVPWVLGQVIALAVNCLVLPDAGARPLAVTIQRFYKASNDALVIPRPRDVRLRRSLARASMDLSTAYRDMRIDITITRFRPDDFGELRNLMQAVIRSLLTIDTETRMFSCGDGNDPFTLIVDDRELSNEKEDSKPSGHRAHPAADDASRMVIQTMAEPTKEILDCLREGLKRSEAALMSLSGYRKHMGPAPEVSSDLGPIQTRLNEALSASDTAESSLLGSGELLKFSSEDVDAVNLLIFSRHAREASLAVQALLSKVEDMQKVPDWPRLYLPSYPWRRAIYRTNRQVRHDIGGITAASYHVTFSEISQILKRITSQQYQPRSRTQATEPQPGDGVDTSHPTIDSTSPDDSGDSPKKGFRYKLWLILRSLQGFEGRYAFKVCLVTSLLSVPSYLEGRGWWDEYEVWWVVAVSWIMIHPRVGGNVQDLITRAFVALLGALWAAAGYGAGRGNPYVMAVFSAIFMIPMLYRFTQSTHPRSGQVGCLSFTVVSLSLMARQASGPTARHAVLEGLAFLVGTVVTVFVNWILWPFVARHELRRALSSMIFFMSIMYRSVVARYVYFEEGREPTEEDVQRSVMLEGHLREGFVRIRQLLVLTRHELRLRAPFDPLPYSALTEACEHFFEYLISVRQSAIHHQPGTIRDSTEAAERLLGYRRDAVAAILGNLYTFAGALRAKRPVPRYLPSAPAARRKLIMRTVEIGAEAAKQAGESDMQQQQSKWSNIYSHLYRESLTGCVAQLEELEKYTKLIVGEQSFYDEVQDPDHAEEPK